MKQYSTRQYIEVFHLIFMDFLGRKLNKKEYVLKGGCNLRFFMKSIRYSEDIDIDVQGIAEDKIESAVEGILNSKSFSQVLRVNGMALAKWSSPKQTSTTQRWKMLLSVDGRALPINTKVEFSRRGVTGAQSFGVVDPLLIETYSLTPFMINHYTRESAYRQKVEALITRTATQARDVFDLHLLLCSGVDFSLKEFDLSDRIPEAVSNAMSVSYDMFKGQVFAYLLPEYQSMYEDESTWDQMVIKVVDSLTGEDNET